MSKTPYQYINLVGKNLKTEINGLNSGLDGLTTVSNNLQSEINRLDENVKQLGSSGGSGGSGGTTSTEKSQIALSYNREGVTIPTSFDKGKIVFTFDDSNADISTLLGIFNEYGYPMSVAAILERLGNKADDGGTILDSLKKIQCAGGEILAHGTTRMDSFTTADDCEYYLRSVKEGLERNGLVIEGWVAPEGAYNSLAEDLYKKYYKYGYFASRVDGSMYRISRTNIANTSLADVKAQIDSCSTNKTLLWLMCHTINGTENGFVESNLREILDYIKTKDVDVTTLSAVHSSMSLRLSVKSVTDIVKQSISDISIDSGSITLPAMAIKYYTNVAAMLADKTLASGDMCKTKGFYSANDGGDAEYIITKDYTVDGYIVLQTAVSELHAVLNEHDTINVKHAGAKGDGTTDDTAAIQAVINTWYVQKIYIPKGTYAVTGLTLTSSTRVIEGDGYWLSTIKCIATKDCDVLYLDNHGAYMGMIRQLRIQGNASYKQNGLNVKPSDAGTSSFTVDYVNIENCKGVGLYIQTYNDRAAYHCNFTNIILQSNGVGADVTLNDGTIANFYCYQSETYGMKIAGFNCRISNGKLAQNSYSHHGSSLSVDATYPAMYLSGARNVLNNLDFQENGGIGLVTADQSRNIMGSNIILDANGSDLLPVGGANGSFSKPWAYIGGFYNSFHFNIANFDNTKPATSIIQSYYSGKTEVYCMDSTGNPMHILPYAKEVSFLPCKDKDFNVNVTSGYTPTYSILYGTKKGLSLPADKYLTISPYNFITEDSFHLMVTFQINYSEDSLTTYQDIFKLGNFYTIYASNSNIQINGAGNASFSSGDIFRFACSGVTKKDNTEIIYNMLYKYNTETGTFEQIQTVNITNASYLTQSDFTLKLGTKLRTDNPSLSIKYCDVAFGHGLVHEQMTKFISSPALHDQCNYYMPLDGDLTCGGIPIVNNVATLSENKSEQK